MTDMTFDNEMKRLNDLIAEATVTLEEAREERNSLLRERFDLKEQRRYLRGQQREAQQNQNEERLAYLNGRLTEVQEKIETIDAKIEELETMIESAGEELESLKQRLDEVAAAQEKQNRETTEADASATEDAEATENGSADEPFDQAVEHLTNMLRTTIQRVSETIDSIDMEQVNRTVTNAAEKAAKVAMEAAEGIETMCREHVQTTKANVNAEGNCTVCGAGIIDGGDYNRLITSGTCKVNGDVNCRKIRSSGSLRIGGNVTCTEEIRASGSFQSEGNVTAESMVSAGTSNIAGNLSVGMLNAPGTLHVGGNVKAGEIKVAGSLRVAGDCESELMNISGALQVDGALNADALSIRLALTDSHVTTIGGSDITIQQSPAAGFLGGILKTGVGNITCDSIEGDHLNLQGVHADVVRGGKVVIGAGCAIDRVEYFETCSIDGAATVGNCVKV